MMGELVTSLADLGRVEPLRAITAEMQQLLGEDGGSDRARAEADHAVATVAYFDRAYETCLASLDRACAGFERVDAVERFHRTLSEKGFVLFTLGRRREATLIRRGILAVATEEGDLRSMASATIDLAIHLDELRPAVELNLEAAAIARRGGYGGTEMTAMANGVEGAVECGAWEIADGLLADLGGRADLPSQLADFVTLGAALIAAYRGDAAGARVAIDEITSALKDTGDPTSAAWYHRALSLLSMMEGDAERAYAEAMVAVEAEPTGPNRPFAVWSAGRAALALGDAAKARAPLELTEEEGQWEIATRRAIEAGIAALEGHPSGAAAAYDAVLAGRLAAGDPFTHALATIDAVGVLPAELVPEGAVETAQAYLEELGAAPLLARLTPSAEPATAER
jgi:hypothetical protein